MAKRMFKKKGFKKDKSAISPIIATLMLILVAVIAGAGIAVWMSNFQGNIQKTSDKANGGGNQNALSIGGSTTAYEFSVYGAQYYESTHPGIQISVQKGGSGAGIAAVGTGAIDIAGSSDDLSANSAYTTNYPDLDHNGVKDIGHSMVETTIAYDAVVLVVQSSNTHKLNGVATAPLHDLYAVNGKMTPALTQSTATFGPWHDTAGMLPSTVKWSDFPRHAIAIAGSTDASGDFTPTVANDVLGLTPAVTGTDNSYAYVSDGAGGWTKTAITGVAPVTGKLTVGATHSVASATAWITCADSATPNAMTIYDRSDVSGTEDTFATRLAGFSKVGNNQLEDNGVTGATHVDSNQNMVAAIGGNANAFGFAAWGVAKTTTSVFMPKVLSTKSDMNNNGVYGEAADVADPTSASTFSTASKTPQTANVQLMQYGGGKKLFYITVDQPTGLSADYINYVLQPENNANICAAGGYIGLY